MEYTMSLYRNKDDMISDMRAEITQLRAELERERELADRFGDVGRLIIDGFGFTSDGNDGYREVETVLIDTLDKLVSDYNATRRNK